MAAALVVAPCDLLLLDLNLPDGDGIEECRTLRGRSAELGIIAVTARGEERDRVTGLRVGVPGSRQLPDSPANGTASRRGEPGWSASQDLLTLARDLPIVDLRSGTAGRDGRDDSQPAPRNHAAS